MDSRMTQDPAELINWLDEQQREGLRQLTALGALAEAQGRELEALKKRLERLERRLDGTQAQFARSAEIGDALQELRNDVLGVLEDSATRLRSADAQLESRLEVQSSHLTGLTKTLEAVQAVLATLETELEALPARIDNQVEETAGLARDIEGLEKRFNQAQARLAQLSERLSDQTDSTAALARQLEHLEGRLSDTRAQLIKFPQIEDALQETKKEIVFMISEIEEQRAREAQTSARLRESERKEIRAALDGIEKRLERIPQLDERIETLAAEDRRLRSLIVEQEGHASALSETTAQHAERLSYLEEEGKRAAHRIDEVEATHQALREVVGEYGSQIRFLQEWAERSAEKIDELKRFEDQLEQWRAGFVEEMRQSEHRRDRRLTDWEGTVADYEKAIDQWQETLRRYELAHQDNRRTVTDLLALAQRLERDQAEVAEQQRLADERLQRELEAWQAENEKRWRFFLKQRDYDWEQEAAHDAQQDSRLEQLEAWRAELTERFAEELDRLDENDRRVLTRIIDLMRYLDDVIERQIAHGTERRAMLRESIQSSDLLVGRSRPEHRPRAAAGRPGGTEAEE